MNFALEPLKKLNNYEKEQGKITKIVASWRKRKDDYDNMPKDGDMSIDFSYPNISSEMVSLSSFRGRLVYIDVWATWCVNCKLEHGFLMSLQNKGIKIFGLNYKDDKEKALRWLDQFGNPYWKTIYDPRGNFGLEIGVSGAPETYLIDKF